MEASAVTAAFVKQSSGARVTPAPISHPFPGLRVDLVVLGVSGSGFSAGSAGAVDRTTLKAYISL